MFGLWEISYLKWGRAVLCTPVKAVLISSVWLPEGTGPSGLSALCWTDTDSMGSPSSALRETTPLFHPGVPRRAYAKTVRTFFTRGVPKAHLVCFYKDDVIYFANRVRYILFYQAFDQSNLTQHLEMLNSKGSCHPPRAGGGNCEQLMLGSRWNCTSCEVSK